MSDRKRLASCLLLSVVALGFLVAEAGAQSVQGLATTWYVYEGYVRLTMGRFSEVIQPALVYIGGIEPYGAWTGFVTNGYRYVMFQCWAIIIYGGDGSVSTSCNGDPLTYYKYAKFWAKGLYPGAPATFLFYIPDSPYGLRGQFSGVLNPNLTP